MELFTKIAQADFCSNIKQVQSTNIVLQQVENTNASTTQRQRTKNLDQIKKYTFIPFNYLSAGAQKVTWVKLV